MTCTSVFKLMPQKGEFIFKVFLVFYFIVIIFFVIKKKQEIHIWYTVCLSVFDG